jgi:dolichol-phosphate mannosyltransferase
MLVPHERPRLVSLVLPVFNEFEVLPLLFERIDKLVETLGISTEVIFVNDGSSDRSIELLFAAAKERAHYKVISLSRNFGHQIAATAGLDCAEGDVVILMDSDLQDPPELVLKMIEKYQEGFDVVYARRIGREAESVFKKLTAWVFYRLMRKLVHPDLPVDVGDFRLVSKQALATTRSLRELHRFLRGMVTWVGYPQTQIDFVRPARAAGTTKYPLRKMLLFAWNAAVSFSPLPMRVSFGIGLLMMSIGVAYAIYALWQYYSGGFVVPGWTSLIVVNCITAGAIMTSIGVLGEYIGRIFEESKARPLYVVSSTVNVNLTRQLGSHPGEDASFSRKL